MYVRLKAKGYLEPDCEVNDINVAIKESVVKNNWIDHSFYQSSRGYAWNQTRISSYVLVAR